ncbi:hypothetical protein [Novosphingobium rosa]|uniref:hypothetical protein n=1 Tax=Novosphingobium rosa TaxID=76978 RepID=UPI0014714384|nr:hypothetical protein [Novosphingobium rosa]
MAMIKSAVAGLAMVAMLFCIQGCSQTTQDTFFQVQLCVIDRQGISQFKQTMRVIAQDENLQFVDGSAETGRDLKVIGADSAIRHDPALSVNVGINDRKGRNYVLGGNLGLPAYQVALGFGAGPDPIQARRLSERLVQALSKHWHVDILPLGKGIVPMKACGG